MSSSMATELDTLSGPSPEARDAARRYMESSGNADLLDMLGLAPVVARPTHCGTCGNHLPKLGVCRKRLTCRAAAREAGYQA